MHKSLVQGCVSPMLALWLALNACAAFADDVGKRRQDHDAALTAVQHGEVLPLEAVLSEARKAVRGEVVGVELERARGNWVYEIKIIASGNSMVQIYVDARTTKILEIKGP